MRIVNGNGIVMALVEPTRKASEWLGTTQGFGEIAGAKLWTAKCKRGRGRRRSLYALNGRVKVAVQHFGIMPLNLTTPTVRFTSVSVSPSLSLSPFLCPLSVCLLATVCPSLAQSAPFVRFKCGIKIYVSRETRLLSTRIELFMCPFSSHHCHSCSSCYCCCCPNCFINLLSVFAISAYGQPTASRPAQLLDNSVPQTIF